MDILSARKKAAARKKAKKGVKAEEPGQQAPEQAAPPQAAGPAVPLPAPVPPEPPAAAAAQPAPEPSADEIAAPQELEMLSFRLGSESYAIPVEQVREVLKPWVVTPLPNAPAHVLGVISLRGTILPVIDVAKRLGLSPGVRDEKSRIVVVSLDDEKVGMVADRVTGVVRFAPEVVKPAPATLELGAGAEFLRGLARTNEALYILLDLEKVAGTGEGTTG